MARFKHPNGYRTIILSDDIIVKELRKVEKNANMTMVVFSQIQNDDYTPSEPSPASRFFLQNLMDPRPRNYDPSERTFSQIFNNDSPELAKYPVGAKLQLPEGMEQMVIKRIHHLTPQHTGHPVASNGKYITTELCPVSEWEKTGDLEFVTTPVVTEVEAEATAAATISEKESEQQLAEMNAEFSKA